jgi:tRNA threonylcarbamoyl adenosine modification protein YeaZ
VRVLAFDCSSAQGSVAVREDGEVVFAERFDSPRGRGGEFFLSLDRAIRATGRPDRIAVGVGPGSYNGLRTTVTASEALHLATGAERVAVASFLALPCEEDAYFALGDARGGVLVLARIVGREILGDFRLLPPEAVLAELEAEPLWPRLSTSPLPLLPGTRVVAPDAAIIGHIAASLPAEERPIEPLYLKPAHITTPKARR